MKISIVIPNWNGREKLEENLPDVLRVKEVDEVIVVDDKSSDESVGFVKENFPQVKLIEKEKNSGFSTTVNLGVKNAKGDFVFLLNSDAKPDEDCLKNILSHFEDERVFSVGCNTGGSWAWAKFEKGFFWHGQRQDLGKESFHQTLWVSGGSGVFRKKVWEKLGGLDEMFNPFYEEDVDLGYRATKRGYLNLFESRAKVIHSSQKGVISQNFSKGKIARVAQRNQLIFMWKNMTSKKLIGQHKLELLKKLLSSPGYWPVFASAFSKLESVLKRRAVEQKEEILSDEEILNKFSA